MTAAQSTAAVILSASLAMQFGPMLTGAVSVQRSAISNQRSAFSNQQSAISVQQSAEHSSAHDAPRQDAAQHTPAPEQDAPEAVALPQDEWFSTLEAAVYTFTKPLVVIVGDRAYADAVRDALGEQDVEFAWRFTEGAERSVSVLRSRDGAALACSETEPAKVAELLRALE